MATVLLLSQSIGSIEADAQIMAETLDLPSSAAVTATSLYDGPYANEPGAPENLFFLLANGKTGGWDTVVLGPSVSAPNPAWTWAILSKLAESLDARARFLIPYQERAAEWEVFRNWAGESEPLGEEESSQVLLELPRRMLKKRNEPHWRAAMEVFLGSLRLENANPNFSPAEYVYLFHGGARRGFGATRAAASALDGMRNGSVVEHGAALGMVSMFWLLLEPRLSRSTAVEIAPKYSEPGHAAARAILPRSKSFEHRNGSIEAFSYETRPDVVTFVHSLYRLARPDRAAAVARAWEALAPGGILLINETIQTAGSQDAKLTQTNLGFAEMIELFAPLGRPALYVPSDLWAQPAELQTADPGRWSADHVIIMKKDRA